MKSLSKLARSGELFSPLHGSSTDFLYRVVVIHNVTCLALTEIEVGYLCYEALLKLILLIYLTFSGNIMKSGFLKFLEPKRLRIPLSVSHSLFLLFIESL